MVGAVHRLKHILSTLTALEAEELIGEFVPVPRGLIEILLRDMRDGYATVLIAGAELPHIAVELLAENSALGCPKGEARADEVGEGEEVKLLPNLSVVSALIRLIFHMQKISHNEPGRGG